MGKYNFNYERLAKLEEENAMLKEKVAGYDELKKRLENIESCLATQKKKRPERTFTGLISDEQFAELFGITVDDAGNITKTNDREIMDTHAGIFKQNLMKILMPKSRYNKQTKKHYVRFANLNDISDSEYNIIAETFQSICDTLAYAKKKLATEREEK